MVVAMATLSLSPQQYQQMVDRIAGLESTMATLQSHAEAQQEQIRVAELMLQQVRATGTPTNPPPTSPPFRAAFQKQVTEGGAFKALTKYVGKPLRVPRLVVQRKTSSHKGGREILLDCCSGSRQPSMRSRRAMCLSFEERRISGL